MDLFINAQSASAGGGVTYLRNVLPHLSGRAGVRATVLSPPGLKGDLPPLPGVAWVDAVDSRGGAVGRFLAEQRAVPALIKQHQSEVLLSVGNVALLDSPVPQILLSRNALYTNRDFFRDTWARRSYALWLDSCLKAWLAKRSVRRAQRVVCPSEAFAAELRRWIGMPAPEIRSIPHGFDSSLFFAERTPMPDGLLRHLGPRDGDLRLLFVSHYNYFRNFDTLIRALPSLKFRLLGKPVKLILTCELRPKPEWGPYDARRTARLVRDLGVGPDIVELGLVPYRSLHHVYAASDIYVTASYAESFAHPLVEAMASGLPVVASDLAVHREVCGDAALYFPRFSPEALADCVTRLARDSSLAEQLGARGLARSRRFSWELHVDEILALAEELVGQGAATPQPGSAVRRLAGLGLSSEDHETVGLPRTADSESDGSPGRLAACEILSRAPGTSR